MAQAQCHMATSLIYSSPGPDPQVCNPRIPQTQRKTPPRSPHLLSLLHLLHNTVDTFFLLIQFDR
ncbi:hypothetical protein CFP56_039908 [Quercus suber]|uniref:Uncharacterized protein n=1 Tax=Quercus suber TaxID=58331 RepID=A0AAW0IYF7_QUESU